MIILVQPRNCTCMHDRPREAIVQGIYVSEGEWLIMMMLSPLVHVVTSQLEF